MKRYLIVCILSISLTLTACEASTPEETTTSNVDTVEVDTNLASKDSIDVPSNLIEDKEETNEAKETEDVVDSTDESKENEDMEAASSDSKVTEVDEDNNTNENSQDSSNTVNTNSANQGNDSAYDTDYGWWEGTVDNAYITSLMFPTVSYTEGTGNGPGANWVKGFDYANLNIGPNQEQWWEMKYWEDLPSVLTSYTASNGITIKVVKNQFAENSTYKNYPILDGKGADLLPGSPYMVAVDEALSGRSDVSKAINSDLSFTMPVTSYKRDSVDVNDSNLLALKASMDASYTQAKGGYLDVEYMFMEPDAIYLRNALNANPIIFERKGDYWEITFLINPAKNLWSWTLNTLKFIDPNAQSIYNEIYHHFYEGSDLAPDYNTWYNVNGTQMMIVDTTGTGTGIFRFK